MLPSGVSSDLSNNPFMVFCPGFPGWGPRSHLRVAEPLLTSSRLQCARQSRFPRGSPAPHCPNQQEAEELLHFPKFSLGDATSPPPPFYHFCLLGSDAQAASHLRMYLSASAYSPAFSCSADKNSEGRQADQPSQTLAFIRITWRLCEAPSGFEAQTFWFCKSGVGLKIYIFNEFPDSAETVGLKTTL